MTPNVGTIDRILRVLLAVVLAGLYFFNVVSGGLGIVLLVLAGVFLLTAVVGVCPLYMPFKFNTLGK